MKVTWMTVSEIAAALKLSVVSIRRAYSKGDIPVVRIGRMVRFDLDHVRMVMQRKGKVRRLPRHGRTCRPARPAASAGGAQHDKAPVQ